MLLFMQNQWLEGRHALITGGGTGIGAAAGAHLHAAGGRITVTGRRMEALPVPSWRYQRVFMRCSWDRGTWLSRATYGIAMGRQIEGHEISWS